MNCFRPIRFQFYKVRLKRVVDICKIRGFSKFQFYKVRLKQRLVG